MYTDGDVLRFYRALIIHCRAVNTGWGHSQCVIQRCVVVGGWVGVWPVGRPEVQVDGGGGTVGCPVSLAPVGVAPIDLTLTYMLQDFGQGSTTVDRTVMVEYVVTTAPTVDVVVVVWVWVTVA
jgi:hypothetical protein